MSVADEQYGLHADHGGHADVLQLSGDAGREAAGPVGEARGVRGGAAGGQDTGGPVPGVRHQRGEWSVSGTAGSEGLQRVEQPRRRWTCVFDSKTKPQRKLVYQECLYRKKCKRKL